LPSSQLLFFSFNWSFQRIFSLERLVKRLAASWFWVTSVLPLDVCGRADDPAWIAYINPDHSTLNGFGPGRHLRLPGSASNYHELKLLPF
jgi:hypothetical protein